MRPHAIDEPVDPAIIAALRQKLPEFAKAYDEDGMTVDDFERFGATVRTLRQFLEADADLDRLIRDILIPAI